MVIKVRDFDTMEREYTFNNDGKVVVKGTQDITQNVKLAAEERANENRFEKPRDLKKVASVPMVIVEELMKKGINPFKKEDQKRFCKEIELNYPYLKTTNMRLWT